MALRNSAQAYQSPIHYVNLKICKFACFTRVLDYKKKSFKC